MSVADDERHPVVDGRHAGIGGGGQQHETFFGQWQVNARFFHVFPETGHAKEIAPAADKADGGFVGFPFVKAVHRHEAALAEQRFEGGGLLDALGLGVDVKRL